MYRQGADEVLNDARDGGGGEGGKAAALLYFKPLWTDDLPGLTLHESPNASVETMGTDR